MKMRIPLAVLAVALMGGAAVAAPVADPAATRPAADGFWTHARWDDDYDDRRRYGPMPRPDQAALRSIGVVRVLEVERDDGRLEIEGVDRRGRHVDVLMDAAGRQVLGWKFDRDDDDRWDD